MGKRFTATEKWMDPWFRQLSTAHKAAWIYLNDNCDAAGVIDLDRPLADFQILTPVDWNDLLARAEHRIERLKSGKLWLTEFCQFQYGELTAKCAPHRKVISILQQNNLFERVTKGYLKPLDTLQEEEEDKEEEGDKDKKKTKKGKRPPDANFAAWWKEYPRKVGKSDAEKAYQRVSKAIKDRPPEQGLGGDAPHAFLLERVKAFAASPTANGEFCPHPTTWLNAGRYDDDPQAWEPPPVIPRTKNGSPVIPFGGRMVDRFGREIVPLRKVPEADSASAKALSESWSARLDEAAERRRAK